MKRIAWLAALWTIGSTSGCVERRFTVYSEPPGALVYLNNKYLGPTPVDGWIVYYGKQQFQLIKEGYETLNIVQKYPAPWWDWPAIDFLTENIWPGKLRDVRHFCYTMKPLQSIPPDDIRARAEELRMRGQNIGVPAPPRPLNPTAPAPAPPDGTLPPPRSVPAPTPGVSGP